MPCNPVPSIPIPTLPDGISLALPLPNPPSVSTPSPCCLLPELPPITLPITLPPAIVNIAFVATLRVAIEAANAWLESLPLTCPRS